MAIGSITPFRPTGTVSLGASTSSVTVQLAGGGDTVVVTNPSASLAYVRFGADPSVSASAVDMPVMANSKVMLSVNGLVSHAAAVLAAGSGPFCSPAATDPMSDGIHRRGEDRHPPLLRLSGLRCGEPGFQNWRFSRPSACWSFA